MSTPATSDDQRPVPVRSILVTIGSVIAAALLLYVVLQTRQVLTWIVVAGFFAVALTPLDDWVQRRLPGGRHRALATLIVFLAAFVIVAGLVTAFVVPLAREGPRFAAQLPQLVDDLRAGRGPVGSLVERTGALSYVQSNEASIRGYLTGLGTSAASALSGVATGLAGIAAVLVLSFLMVLEGPKVVSGFTGLFAPDTGERIRRVGADCAKSVTGYLSGNLLISLICGVLTYGVLKISGVPFASLIALFVAVMDLVPLVGATIGGVVATIAGLVHSVPAGIAVVVFFVVYQQLENHLLQPVIFARTVKLNPLTVIIAILVAVELAGILGALLAIPVASIVQVIVRDLWDHRRGRLKAEPTVGEERRPAVAPQEGSDARAHHAGRPTASTAS